MLAGRTTAVIALNLFLDLPVAPRFRGREMEPLVRQGEIPFNEVLVRQVRVGDGGR